MLKRVYVLTPEERADREFLRTRRQILEHRNDVARQIKSKLLFHGIRPPFSAQAGWSKAFIQWIRDLSFGSDFLKVSLQSLLELYEYLTRQVMAISPSSAVWARFFLIFWVSVPKSQWKQASVFKKGM
jgi:hypothetical protein